MKKPLVCMLFFVAAHCGSALGHGLGPWGHPMDWHNDQIDQVVSSWGMGQKLSVEGRECLVGGSLNFKVNDEYAFDIDETVWLNVEFYLSSAPSDVSVSYGRNDEIGGTMFTTGDAVKKIHLPEAAGSNHWYTQVIPLEHARFANLGFEGSDFSISSQVSDIGAPGSFRLCNVSLKRSFTTSVAKTYGEIAVEVADEKGELTPARMGIYNSSMHLPLPGDEALALRNSLTETARVISLGGISQSLPTWPVQNRSVFYTDGRYRARLPSGEYELIVAKGPEYRIYRQLVKVQANRTLPVRVLLRRWTDMAAKGWYSGEDHIHYPRSSTQDDRNLLLFIKAEDLRVANILQFDNSARTYLEHYDWTPAASAGNELFVLVPGQEAPRTTRFGHTELLNIREPVRDPAQYLLYNKAFERAHELGGLVGYAHAVGPQFDPETYSVKGMAIDVPFGIVDFQEIKTLHVTGTSIWFDFLNLGYKISPTAGTDYPFGGVPGTVRNYVKIAKPFTSQSWFDQLQKGCTFVTSGPMLQITANGKDIGSDLHLKTGEPITITATATLNPDYGRLSTLELVEQGDVMKTVSSTRGSPSLKLRYTASADHGTWFVLRAQGNSSEVSALSAPIYVLVDGQSFWKRSAVPAIVDKMKSTLKQIGENQPETTEAWEAQALFNDYWKAQQNAIRQRIDKAIAIYDDLVKRASRIN